MRIRPFSIGHAPVPIIAFGVLLLSLAAVDSRGQEAVETDGVPYKTVNGTQLLLDIESPTSKGVPRPALVFLCGNAWGYADIDRGEFAYALDLAVEHGYIGVTVDTSATREHIIKRPIGTFPAQVYDAKSAIRFLRANAKEYGIDPSRIGVIGHSSGAYLGLMLALTEPADGLEGEDDNAAYSSSVQAVVSFAGPTDLTLRWNQVVNEIGAYMGATPQAQPDAYKKASPITYARPGKAPILTIQGDQDLIIEEAVLFDKRMKEVGGAHTLIIKKGAGHMDFDVGDKVVWDFLDGLLKK